MIARIIFAMIALIPLSSSVEAGTLFESKKSSFSKKIDASPTLRILIAKDKTGLDMEIQGKFRIFDPRNGEHLATRKLGRKGVLETTSAGIKWGEGFPGIHQLLIVPDSINTTIHLDGREYQGSLYVYEVDGKLSVVNRVNVETLLSTILSNEIKDKYSPEVLASIAIAARTTTYFLAENPKNPYWAFDADQIGYKGVNRNINHFVDEAIHLSRFMVLTKRDSFESPSNIFPASFVDGQSKIFAFGRVNSKISLSDAKQLAEKGQTASQILAKAFPGSEIVLFQYSKGS